MITIDKLAPADRADWEVLFTGYNTFYERTLAPELFERAWTAFQDDSRMHAFGAKLDGKLVGITHFLVHASTTAPDVCYLQDLFTAPEARGHGVARALIAAVTEWARARECSRVYWSTHETNATARRLYDKVAVNRGFILYQITL
ncbi:GNAT family N-acetyltransferase [Amycolatopsis nigrescens]|uniref:GNAT family N-acetyltransferase n=1 Tax=Amycolatopsis nigrescens TaxID=381445 RepID=UPI00037EC4E8|nr:GNAT family N-acetyltransferase [Amycolatopsis nigrescens]